MAFGITKILAKINVEKRKRKSDVLFTPKEMFMKWNNTRLLWLLVLLRIVIPYLLQNGMYEPHRDEFLYLAEGNHLSFGFMEVPPMLSIFAWLTHLLGDGMVWIKLWSSLFGAATFYVMGRLVLLLGGSRFALWLLFLSFLLSAYLRVFFLFQPNAPEVFFWTMIVFCLIRYVQTHQMQWLYGFGVCAGLGMLSKYSVLFYITGLLLGLLLTPQRKLFTNKHFWAACGVGALLFLPNFLWQWQHHFPVRYHMAELQRTQLQYVSPAQFFGDQVTMFLPCIFVWLCGLFNLLFSPNEKAFRFVGFAYLFVILILLAGHGKGYYALGAYPILFAFGSYHLEKFTALKRRALRYVFVFAPFLLGIIFIPVALPLFAPAQLVSFYEKWNIKNTGALRWEDGQNHPLPQDFSDMQGWEEMAGKVAKAYHSLPPEEQQNSIIFCNNYGMAGAVNFYGKKYNLPEAYSDNASFLYWLPQNKNWRNLILVCDDPDELKKSYIKDFREAYFTDSVTNEFARERGDRIMVAKGANEEFKTFFMDKIKKDKEKLMPK